MIPRVLALCALSILIGSLAALPFEEPRETLAAFSDVAGAGASFEVAIPEGRRCVLWARSASLPQTLHISGSRAEVDGCLHSNGDLVLTGSGGTFGGILRHAGDLRVEGRNQMVQAGSARVPVSAEPYFFRAEDYRFSGAEAARARAEGRYFVHPSGATITEDNLSAGIHYGLGDLEVIAGDASLDATFAAEGELRIVASGANLRPYAGGLLAASWSAGVETSGEDSRFAGALYAPNGPLHLTGARNALVGWGGGDRVHVSMTQARLVAENPLALS